MPTEILFLLLTALLTGVLWIPSVLGQVKSRGFLQPEDYVNLPTASLVPWATRANRAHINAVENFSTFAAVIIVGQLLGVSSSLTAGAAAVFFFARLAHAAVMIAGVKHFMARTMIFTVGWTAFVIIAEEVLRLGLAKG